MRARAPEFKVRARYDFGRKLRAGKKEGLEVYNDQVYLDIVSKHSDGLFTVSTKCGTWFEIIRDGEEKRRERQEWDSTIIYPRGTPATRDGGNWNFPNWIIQHETFYDTG